MALDKAYRDIFASKNLHENLSKINGEFKDNELVTEVIKFIEKDKKDQFACQKAKIFMIGLIFGETDFPQYVLKKLKESINI